MRAARTAAPWAVNRRGAPDDVASDAGRVGLAVVGLGLWGPHLLRALYDDPRARVEWLCDLDPARLSAHSGRNPSARTTTEFGRVLADPAVDAVLLATPVATHNALAVRALGAGKHVFVEKPMSTDSSSAQALVALARQRGRVLMCGHTFLYSPPVRAIKGLLDAGALGDVYFVSASRVNLGLHQRDVSVICDLGAHDFSILLYWLGEMPDAVSACGRDSIVKGIADVAFVTMTFPSGIVAKVELSWLAPSRLRRTVLVGSRHMVIYDDGAPEPVRVFDRGVVYRDPETFGEYHLSYRTGGIVAPSIDCHEPLELELRDFVDAAAAGRHLTSNTDVALGVVRIVEAAERSMRQDGRSVQLDPGADPPRAPVSEEPARVSLIGVP